MEDLEEIMTSRKKRIVPPESIPEVVDEILSSYFCLPSVMTGTSESRLHDDHDGEGEGKIHVTMGPDGDMWVSLSFPRQCIGSDGSEDISLTRSPALRFRMPLCGGGLSHHTRNALCILARAIQLDNERKEPLLY